MSQRGTSQVDIRDKRSIALIFEKWRLSVDETDNYVSASAL